MITTLCLLLQLFSEPGIPVKGISGALGNIQVPGYQALCFHDIRNDVHGNFDPDPMAVSTKQIFGYFSWLREHGFNVISLDDILAAESGERPLPPKAVLLTFDDGLLSAYTKVFPMLKLFNYHAVIAPVVSWIENPRQDVVKYAGKVLDQEGFMTWAQMKEMAEHPLIDIGHHSYDLHRGVLGNPQGNFQPAAVTRIYDPLTGTFESDEVYYQRIYRDLKIGAEIIERETGKRPRMMVWPFGEHNRMTIDIARELGMDTTLVLEQAYTPVGRKERIARHLVMQNPDLGGFAWNMLNAGVQHTWRMITIDLDDLYHPDSAVYTERFDKLISRINNLKVNIVIIKAFTDEDGDGAADAVYFNNRHLPVKADLMNRVAWQIFKRGGAQPYAWLPLTAFNLPENKGVYVQSLNLGEHQSLPRLSIFDNDSREIIFQIYEDMGKSCDFSGLYMADDAFLTPKEDVSKPALDYYASRWNLPSDPHLLTQDGAIFEKWMKLKAQAIVDFTMEIKYRVDYFRAPLRLIRSLPSEVIMNPQQAHWQASLYPEYWRYYDLTALTSMPHFQKPEDQMNYLTELLLRTRSYDPALSDSLAVLRTWDDNNQPLPAKALVDLMDFMKKQGLIHYGLDYDDFVSGRPDLTTIRMGISLEDFPYR